MIAKIVLPILAITVLCISVRIDHNFGRLASILTPMWAAYAVALLFQQTKAPQRGS